MLKFLVLTLVGLFCITTITLIIRKKNTSRVMLVNLITNQMLAVFVMLAIIFKEYSIIDMAFFYIILSVCVPLFLYLVMHIKSNNLQ
jgi:multisubunit Na+/H+ antiporter MnhF subunit